MKSILLTLAFLAMGLCNPVLNAADGNVAIVDLDLLSKELGVQEFITTTVQNLSVGVTQDLKTLKEKLEADLKQKLEKAGNDPDANKRKELFDAQNQMSVQYKQVADKAHATIAAHRQKMINDFRDELRPIALESAKAQGFAVVMQKGPLVYGYLESAEITEDVLKRAKVAGMTKTAPASKTQ